MTTPAVLLRNARRAGWAPTMLHKVWLRVAALPRRREPAASARWCATVATEVAEWARARDPGLWDAAVEAAGAQRAYAEGRIRELGLDLGGGGHHPLLTFLVRWRRPARVLETGVAAGFSSRAILLVLRANGAGELRSSDFPYFRLEDPERYVGYLVEPELRQGWRVETDGDRRNLPRLLADWPTLDLFHYDSDKSASGRRFAERLVLPRLVPGGFAVFDDVQDDLSFRRLTARLGWPWWVFPFEGKYAGVVQRPEADGATP